MATILLAIAGARVAADQDLTYNAHIRPILSENCLACHGPDAASREADLRLDIRDGAVQARAIVPGNAAASEIVRRIRSTDPHLQMPPPDSGKRLTSRQIDAIAAWVDKGANWQQHWSFVPPRRARVPKHVFPESWDRNPIDRFVFKRLQDRGLTPNPSATRHILARRLALDLTGLPPEPALVEAFVSDSAPHAYTRLVAALLASPHAAEHRARYWLDAARYADTHGMHMDNYREIWPYRDWVVNAFRRKMPFNQFVTEQLAGDLLPSSDVQQLIATGFNRCHVTTAEGGSIPEELTARYMIDRVKTVSMVFMGLTAGCAVCHDHKYDPLTQREFYQLAAFFNNTTQAPLDGNQKDAPPVVVLPEEKFLREWQELRNLRGELSERMAAMPYPDSASQRILSQEIVHPVSDEGLVLWLPLTEGEGNASILPDSVSWSEDHPAGRRGVRFDAKGGFPVPVFGPLRTDQPFTLSFWLRTPDQVVNTTLFQQSAAGSKAAWKLTSTTRGQLMFQVTDAGGKSILGLLPGDNGVQARAWQHVCIRYSGGQADAAIRIAVDGRNGNLRPDSQALIEAAALPFAPLQIGGSLVTGGLSDVRLFQRYLLDEEVELLADEFALRAVRKSRAVSPAANSAPPGLWARYLRYRNQETYRAAAAQLAATQRRYDYIYARSTTSLVTNERAGSLPRASVLERGQYDRPGESVTADVPAMLPPMSDSMSRNRLGLAEWLVHADHPLTARVTVNRLWQSLFGTGIVRTSEDFGVMGDPPTHPQLLDWLAVEFIESGWDVQHMLNLMVTSATYRQASHVTAEKLRVDPENRFFSRGPRFRLDGEVLRDQTLAVSGLLNRRVGGPAVRPYQPPGLWRVVAIGASNTSSFRQDQGDALYRRSLYSFWKRTAPPPALAVFDAPTREECTVRRERTNTPLQALVLMNDTQCVEAARHLAAMAMRNHNTDSERARFLIYRALMRPAKKADVEDLREAVAGFESAFQQSPDQAAALISVGDSKPDTELDPVELAAWTLAANIVLNRDDFIQKD